MSALKQYRKMKFSIYLYNSYKLFVLSCFINLHSEMGVYIWNITESDRKISENVGDILIFTAGFHRLKICGTVILTVLCILTVFIAYVNKDFIA